MRMNQLETFEFSFLGSIPTCPHIDGSFERLWDKVNNRWKLKRMRAYSRRNRKKIGRTGRFPSILFLVAMSTRSELSLLSMVIGPLILVYGHGRGTGNHYILQHVLYMEPTEDTQLGQTIQCYSCMSKRLEGNWDSFRPYHHRPLSFTEYCDRAYFHAPFIKTRNCSSYCIWINGRITVFGQIIPVTTRGCLSDLIGYRQHAIAQLKSSSSCMKVRLSDLYEKGHITFTSDEKVILCACRSSYCNGVPPKPLTLGHGQIGEYQTSVNIEQDHPQGINCYTCVSARPGVNVSSVWPYFRRPGHISTQCRPNDFLRIGGSVKMCPDHCVWILAKVETSGRHVPFHARGCMADIVKYRHDSFNRLRRKEACVDIRLAELNRPQQEHSHVVGLARLCSCHSNYCNGYPFVLTAMGQWKAVSDAVLIFILFIVTVIAGRE